MLPSIIDTARDHLFDDVTAMKQAGIPEVTQQRIIRLRDVYNYWLQFPSLRDRDLVAHIQQSYGLQTTQAYADLRIVKAVDQKKVLWMIHDVFRTL